MHTFSATWTRNMTLSLTDTVWTLTPFDTVAIPVKKKILLTGRGDSAVAPV
jgi:hypothetical protein